MTEVVSQAVEMIAAQHGEAGLRALAAFMAALGSEKSSRSRTTRGFPAIS